VTSPGGVERGEREREREREEKGGAGGGGGITPLPAARRPPTSRAQRRYLAEGKSLLDHPRRLLVAGAWATLFQGARRVSLCAGPAARNRERARACGPLSVYNI